MISSIAAIGEKGRELGLKGKVPWKIPEDSTFFMLTTKGHPIIMGRRTWEADLERRPLPKRTNIIVTSDPTYEAVGAIATTSIENAIAQAKDSPGSEEIFIIGGAKLYETAMPYIDRLYLTLVEGTHEADTFFPDYSEFTKVVRKTEKRASGGYNFSYVTLER
jgi:dihydrofolate reductase